MKKPQIIWSVTMLIFCLLFFFNCNRQQELGAFYISPAVLYKNQQKQTIHLLAREVQMKDYFDFMDAIVCRYDSLLNHSMSEHLIVRNNPWIIDTLAATDYYRLKERGIINLDQQELVIFRPGNYLIIPDSSNVDSLNRLFDQTYLDVNVPEYKLRIVQHDTVAYKFPVRVGRNERKYLAMAGRTEDLRTRTGEGTIIRHAKDPVFINPSNNHYYHVTRRDDGTVTAMPRIPWIEPEINGRRYGQLIHPTTNIETLGKAYSNGCIGTSEAAAWRIYYHSPLGTRIVIRYDLNAVNDVGEMITLEDIY